MTEKKLTPKQQRFVSEYLKCWNATEAARKAGYKGNDATLSAVGGENLRKPLISEAIERAKERRNDRLELEEDYELKMAQKILKMAIESEDLQNANTAVKTMAQLRGKFVKKIQVGFADNLAEELGLSDDDK